MHPCSTAICCILIAVWCIGCVTPGPSAADGKKPAKRSSSDGTVSSTVDPHADLPTKFGDEDDVIAKKHAALLPPEVPSGKNGRGRPKKQHAFGADTEEEEYDEENDDELDKGDRDESHYKSGDYGDELEEEEEEEEESELGPPLENFGDVKLDGGATGDQLPVFLLEPQSTFVIRSRAAVLKCQAAHALKVWKIFSNAMVHNK